MRAKEKDIKQQNYFHEDLTEQRQKLHVLGQFAGGIAHDFNNILSIIEGYAHIIRKGQCWDDQTDHHLEKIIQTAQRGAGITRQLLMFGRQSIGLDKVIDLNAYIRSQADFLKTAIDSNNHLELDLSDDELRIECDPNAIIQIFLNLAVNARDAMREGGTFKIHTHKALHKGHDFVQIKVSDTGIGIPPEIVDTIFEPFFTTKEQGQGTGLGLSTVFGLIDQMKGEIYVSSLVGQGTDFELFIPLTQKPVYKDSFQEERDTKLLAGKTVLLAEDEPDLRDVLQNMLHELDLNVIPASDGNDFLLTDIVMPNMSGQALAELFQSVRPETKIVYMSGYPYGHSAVKNLEKHIPFLSKPLRQSRLQQVLGECLGQEGFKSKH